jgi:hypothetical protein
MKKNGTKKTKKIKKRNICRTFKKRDYISGDGMLTTVWGPALWHSLHTISFNYPVKPTLKEKKDYRSFVLNLVNVLPCRYCRENLKKNFSVYPLTMKCMKNRDSFSRYMYNLHERINKNLGKKSGLTYCDIRERYEHFRARCVEEKPKIFNFKKTKKNKSEKGCTEPLYGKKAKCLLKIVPQNTKCKTMEINKETIKEK